MFFPSFIGSNGITGNLILGIGQYFQCNHQQFTQSWRPKCTSSKGFSLVMDRVLPETRVSGFGIAMENWLKTCWTRLFFIFCQIFDMFDEFSKWSLPMALQNFKKSSSVLYQKKGNTPCSPCLKPIFFADFGYPKIQFGVPDPSLKRRISKIISPKQEKDWGEKRESRMNL